MAGANDVLFAVANALNLGASTVSGALNVTTGGPDGSEWSVVEVTGSTSLSAGSGDITLENNPANNFSTLAITSANNVNLVDSNALDLRWFNYFGSA